MTRQVFVFGSNLAGRHGKGAALAAIKEHGAIYGRGIGRQGNSYAIPTKDEGLRVLPLGTIEVHVGTFIKYARSHSDLEFQVTAIGCGLAGYKPSEIAPLFASAQRLANVQLPEEFKRVLDHLRKRS